MASLGPNELNSNLGKSRWSITSISLVQSYWNVAQSMTVSLPCSVQICKPIGQLGNKLGMNEVSQDYGSRWISDRYPTFHSPPPPPPVAVAYLSTFIFFFSGWKSTSQRNWTCSWIISHIFIMKFMDELLYIYFVVDDNHDSSFTRRVIIGSCI